MSVGRSSITARLPVSIRPPTAVTSDRPSGSRVGSAGGGGPGSGGRVWVRVGVGHARDQGKAIYLYLQVGYTIAKHAVSAPLL